METVLPVAAFAPPGEHIAPISDIMEWNVIECEVEVTLGSLPTRSTGWPSQE
jgi:hypothetical protein